MANFLNTGAATRATAKNHFRLCQQIVAGDAVPVGATVTTRQTSRGQQPRLQLRHSSLDLHELSHAKSNEIGVLASTDEDEELFQSLSEEADRTLRISDEVRMSFEKCAG
ncbi:MAG: hypothetical protein ACR2II_01970 [Chthoniobacterales bacterium]